MRPPLRLLVAYGLPGTVAVLLAAGSLLHRLPFDWLETFGFITGAWGVWLQVRENVWTWPIEAAAA